MAKRHPKEKKSKKEVVTKEREKEQAPDEREALKAVQKGQEMSRKSRRGNNLGFISSADSFLTVNNMCRDNKIDPSLYG